MAATSFPLFMYLPFELRARVWELTVEPRTVKVGLYRETPPPDYDPVTGRLLEVSDAPLEVNVIPFTPAPAIVQVCREVRRLGPYRKVFKRLGYVRNCDERRYVWLSPELDIIDVERIPLIDFKPYAAVVKRLKLDRMFPNARDFVFLQECVNLKELHIVPREEMVVDWHAFFTRFPPSCGLENIFMVDSRLGLVPLRAAERRSDLVRRANEDAMSQIEEHLRLRIEWEVERKVEREERARRWKQLSLFENH